jgi:hypothetical protein
MFGIGILTGLLALPIVGALFIGALRGEIDLRIRADLDSCARRPVEHPGREFLPATQCVAIPAAAKRVAARLLNQLMNMDDASSSRMPTIQDLALLDPVGVPSLSCTTPSDRTHR